MNRMRYGIRSLLALILITACSMAAWTWFRTRAAHREAAINSLVNAPDGLGMDFNPVALVRAVNQLHSLGRQEALLALKEFGEVYPNYGGSGPHQSLELVIPLLFDRKNPDEQYPRPIDTFDSSKGIELSRDSWNSWVVTEDGIPFHTVYIQGASGMSGDNSYLIVWAKDHARLRQSPLIPGDLFRAAEKVMRRIGEKKDSKDFFEWTERHIRMQVYRAVENTLDLPEDDDSLKPYDDERWLLLKKRCDELGVVWNKELQAFTSTRDLSGS